MHPLWQDDGMSDTEELEFLQDSAVLLYESGTEVLQSQTAPGAVPAQKDGQLLSFVTNVWELPADVIAEIYRQRWDIEVLFRF
ncbi:MAG: hypothetical protein R2830_19465 [Saprospiraceae bacterium]